jgi:3-deoxy-D-manno-octulosonate 8-phosphate phosphatase (KDO 8-P phosphatase)
MKNSKMAKLSKPLIARLKRIKLFLCDVDGVLTDGSIFIGGEQEIKRFNIRDGLGSSWPGAPD